MFQGIVSRIRKWRMKSWKAFGKKSDTSLQVSFGSIDPDVARALSIAFDEHDEVEVVEGNLLDLSCNAIVAPANSFGDMGGGLDKAIDDFHDGEIQRRLMAAIADEYCGELPVGCAVIIETMRPRFPLVVAAPTMRVPGSIIGTINPYLSMRAALVAVLRHNRQAQRPIRSIAIPGLGTGVGGISGDVAAEQMHAAALAQVTWWPFHRKQRASGLYAS